MVLSGRKESLFSFPAVQIGDIKVMAHEGVKSLGGRFTSYWIPDGAETHVPLTL